MTKKELIRFVQIDTGYTQKEISEILDSITTNIGNSLIHGEDVKITEFGTFKLQEVSPRRIMNVKTGEYQITKITRKIKFMPCIELSNAMKD